MPPSSDDNETCPGGIVENCIKVLGSGANSHIELFEKKMEHDTCTCRKRRLICLPPDPKRQNTMVSPARQSPSGQTLVVSIQSGNQVDSGGTGSTTQCLLRPLKRKESATVVFRPLVKKTTSVARSNTCEEDIPNGISSPISEVVSTGSAKVLEPFFDSHCKEMSRMLRSRIETDCPGLDLNLSNSYWKNKEFGCSATHVTTIRPENKNLSKTSFQLSLSSVQKFTEHESTRQQTGKFTRIRAIEILPDQAQRPVLMQWFGTCRYVYNQCVAYERTHGIKTRGDHFQWLRNRFVTNKNLVKAQGWMKMTPKHIRSGAVKDFVTARKAAFTNKRNGNIKKFRIGFRKKNDRQSISIERSPSGLRAGPTGLVLYKSLINDPLKTRTPIGNLEFKHDCRLIFKDGRFYLQVPVDIESMGGKAPRTDKFCAIDPGVRTFASLFSTTGFSQFGTGFGAKMFARLVALDNLRSKIDMERDHRKRKRKKLAFERLSTKRFNIVKDFHYKVAHEICTTFDNIVIPAFGSKGMSSKQDRRLKTKTVRQMSCLSHGLFRQRLIETADRMGKNVYVASEEYTTKTCCCCGTINENVGSKKVFRCVDPRCGFVGDRDLHAGFNIFLKFLSETSAVLGR